MKDLNKNSTSIKNWAVDDQPREKLTLKGKEALSNAELLAILINNGSKEKTALGLAQDILQLSKHNLTELHKLTIKDLQKIKGIGIAKAITIVAALELGKRRHLENILDKVSLTSSKSVAHYLQTLLENELKEHFVILYCNQAQKLIGYEKLSEGGITGTVADPRIIFKNALQQNATGIIICHNHPSGSLKPSDADKKLTEKLKQAGKLLEIQLIDHIIVSQAGYYSFSDNSAL